MSASVTVTTSTAQGLRVTKPSTTSAPFPVHPCAISPHIALDSVQQPPHCHHFALDSVHCVGVVTLTPCQRFAKPCNSSDKIQGFSCLTMKDCAFCMKCATNSGCFALFWRGLGGYTIPSGVLCKPGSGRGYPQKYSPGTKSHFFWMRLNSEKLKNLRKTKKARPESGVVVGRVPLLGKVGRMG